MMEGVFHVIMAGGSGTRFWPVSRTGRPKQFLPLVGGLPLIKQAFDRAAAMSGEATVYVAAGQAHEQMILEALPGFDASRFIAEPCGRNTAPCVGLAALELRRAGRQGVMVVAPADHLYANPAELVRAIGVAVEAARTGGSLVTLGIRPSRPDTGFGYIELEEPAAGAQPEGARRARRFVEKPDAATAKSYLSSGRFLWNSGIFIWRIDAILAAIESFAPEVWRGLLRIEASLGGPDQARVTQEAFQEMPSISVDYAVVEKAPDVLVVPTDPGWSDVGSWDAVAELSDTDAAGNGSAAPGGEVLHLNSSQCFVYSTTGRLISLVGVSDVIVVDTGDALLVCRKGDSQSVRSVVDALKARGRGDLT